jgi:hypothetical protein
MVKLIAKKFINKHEVVVSVTNKLKLKNYDLKSIGLY